MAITLLASCLEELQNMTPKENKIYLSTKVSAVVYLYVFPLLLWYSITGYTEAGYTQASWKLGRGGHMLGGVCRKFFRECYEIGN